MNTRRFIFWGGFIIILGLIIWGLIVAMNKPTGADVGAPAPITVTDHVQGPVDAPITIIEYSDFQCPACAYFQPFVTRFWNEASTSVRIVYRHFPLDNLLPDGSVQHPNAVPAAMASEAAAKQGKFWEMVDMLFEGQSDWESLPNASSTFLAYATELGLDPVKFTADFEDKTNEDLIQSQKNEGIRIGISYTPTFFVNGKIINNPQTYEEFKTLVESTASANPL
ncbi:MAG: thioredoxin domain-containing protein [Candidatus Paceibacterota bacterium]|jgi:protein-disulfide isomerase